MIATGREYRASPTLSRFHRSDAFMRGCLGPIGSGKSVACCVELLRRAVAQAPDAQGVRRTRWAVLRNTYGELADTTVRTMHDWVPPDGGAFRWHADDMRYHLTPVLTDGTRLDCEILFRALDKPKDAKKLLSLELTGAWLNEAREMPLAIVLGVLGRVGRFPSARDGGPTWFGAIADTNPPDVDHWWYRQFEELRPDNWALFRQPSALAPDAENLANLPPGYYANLMAGAPDDWVQVYVRAQYGFVAEGRPVFPEFNDQLHTAREPLRVLPERPLAIGLDFGLTPAALFGQRDVAGRWRIFHELIGEGIGIQRFAEGLRAAIAEHAPGIDGADIQLWCDPAGAQRAETDERSCFDILRAEGFSPRAAPAQDMVIRRESVAAPLGRLIDGKPGFLLSPTCAVTRKALAGGYAYRRLQLAGEQRFSDKPDKNRYSHPADALQYLLSGAGEAAALLARKPKGRAWDPLAAARAKLRGGRARTWMAG